MYKSVIVTLYCIQKYNRKLKNWTSYCTFKPKVRRATQTGTSSETESKK
jgi:hypothetical protein